MPPPDLPENTSWRRTRDRWSSEAEYARTANQSNVCSDLAQGLKVVSIVTSLSVSISRRDGGFIPDIAMP